MNKIKDKLNRHKIAFLTIIMASFILMLPLIFGRYCDKDDSSFHLANVIATEQNINEMGTPDTILPLVANHFGYGTRILYPPLGHTFIAYIFHYIKLMDGNVINAFQIFHIIIMIFSGLAMYFLSLKISNNKKIAIISGLIYITMPYHLADIYVRESVAECLLFPFLPLIVNGVISLMNGNKKAFYPLFVIGYVGAILSHFTMMIYFTIILAILILIFHKKTLKKNFILPFIIGSFVVLLITLFFFEPMLYYKLKTNIGVFQNGSMSGGVYWSTLYPHELLPFNRFRNDINFHFAFIPFVLAIITFIRRKELKLPEYTKGLFIVLLVCILLVTKLFLWDILPKFLYMIQFSWRICTFIALFFAILAPLCLIDVKNKKQLTLIAIGITLSGLIIIHGRTNVTVDLDDLFHRQENMGWQQEYLPGNAYQNKMNDDDTNVMLRDHNIRVNNESVVELISNPIPYMEFVVKKIDEETIVELPRLFYPGYKLVDTENNTYELHESDEGMIETKIDQPGIYKLYFVDRKTKHIANKISVAALGLSIILYGWYCYKTRNKEKIEIFK